MQYDMTRIRLPHSEIPGSKLALSSPRLIAEFYVLHRYWLSRHPLLVPLVTFLCIDLTSNRCSKTLPARSVYNFCCQIVKWIFSSVDFGASYVFLRCERIKISFLAVFLFFAEVSRANLLNLILILSRLTDKCKTFFDDFWHFFEKSAFMRP